jgi:hypothetical protein
MTKERARQKALKYLEWADLADKKREALSKTWYATYKDFDWSEPVKLGHHSQKRHEKMFEKKDSFFRKQIELEKKAERFREKADNLNRFANTNKGDAQRRKEQERLIMDSVVLVGTDVETFLVRGHIGKVVKVFKNSYRVDFGELGLRTYDKRYVSPVVKNTDDNLTTDILS